MEAGLITVVHSLIESSLAKRVFMAILYGPVILLTFWYGRLPLFILLTGVVILGQWELIQMSVPVLRYPHRIIGYVTGIVIMSDTFFNGASYLLGIIISSLALYFILEIITSSHNKFEIVKHCLFITVYPAILTSYLLKIEKLPYMIFGIETRFIIFIMLLYIWLFDSASYFAGRFWGREPFFPEVSPRKTREGFIGGFIAVLIMSVVVSWITNWTSFFHFLAIGVLTALAGQLGDLAESLIKRGMGVKDSSNLIPGHGGILDRFDSLIFAGPIIYFYLHLCCRFWGGCL